MGSVVVADFFMALYIHFVIELLFVERDISSEDIAHAQDTNGKPMPPKRTNG